MWIFSFLDATISSTNSDIEQLCIKSSDTSIPAALAHNYLLSAQTSDDMKQWYKALQESKLLENSVLSCRKRSQQNINKEVGACYKRKWHFYLLFSVATERLCS